jgi:hypothetical protein
VRVSYPDLPMVRVLNSAGGRWRVRDDVRGTSTRCCCWREAVDLARAIAREHGTSFVVAWEDASLEAAAFAGR